VAELQREVRRDHPLFGKRAKALAAAEDRDDVLFEISEGGGRTYAVVHLTWSRRMEPFAKIPWTEVFGSLAQWLERMKADHGDYTYGESS